jgi:hypothetical protein
MENKYLGQEVHELILGEKLSGFRSPKSSLEKEHMIKLGREWMKTNPGKHVDFY